MSAETLRRAASLMRERAEAAEPLDVWIEGGWRPHPATPLLNYTASWPPAVALAVARLLETEATLLDNGLESEPSRDALTVARTYLGEGS